MIIKKGHIDTALEFLARDKNNAVSYIYNNAKNGIGQLEEATITIKDIFATSDAPTQASSLILNNFCPNYDAEVITKLKNAGAAIVGKTHLDELALGGTGSYSAFGIINNPLDSRRMPGGSSSGSAVTLDDSITFALGSDTGDSVRLPASYVGKVGFKPSYGAVSRYGLFPYATSLDTVAWFSHNVHDSIELAKVLYGKDEKDYSSVFVEKPASLEVKPRRVAILDLENDSPSYINVEVSSLAKQLQREGIEVETVHISKELLELLSITYQIISFSEASSNDANLSGLIFGNQVSGESYEEIMINSRSKGFGKMVQRRFTLGSYFLLKENQEEYFLKSQRVRHIIKQELDHIFSSFDLLITPSSDIAPLWSEGKSDPILTDILLLANFAGLPSISLPFGEHQKMPFGLCLNGPLYKDKDLLSYSLYFERLLKEKNE